MAKKSESKPKSSKSKKTSDDLSDEKSEIKVKKISPFDIINAMFTDDAKFASYSNQALEQNYFMINRTMSIRFPIEAMLFSKLAISKAEVVKVWKDYVHKRERIGKVPFWCYAKGSKRTSEEDSASAKKLSLEEKRMLALRLNVGLKEISDMEDIIPDRLAQELKTIKDLASIKEQEKAITKTK